MAPQDTEDPDGSDAGWSALHGGIEPSPVVRAWLRLVRALAAGPVARIPPDALSVAGVLVLVGAGAVAVVGPPALAVVTAVLVVVAGILDGLDGAVALRTGRARPFGAVVDAVCDRLGDLVLAGILVVLGAPGAWAGATAALVFLHEYARARAQSVGMPGVGAVTVAERPTRLIVVALAAVGAAASPAGVPATGWAWGTTFAVTWVALGIVGLAQLGRGLARSVPRTFPPQPPPAPDR